MKICSTCKLLKDKFYKNKYRADGLQTYCVDCSKKLSKKCYESFSEEKKQKIKKTCGR